VPYPLAHERPFVSGRRLVREAQEEAGIDGEFALVAEASGQYISCQRLLRSSLNE
jgi:hypothetical protein